MIYELRVYGSCRADGGPADTLRTSNLADNVRHGILQVGVLDDIVGRSEQHLLICLHGLLAQRQEQWDALSQTLNG